MHLSLLFFLKIPGSQRKLLWWIRPASVGWLWCGRRGRDGLVLVRDGRVSPGQVFRGRHRACLLQWRLLGPGWQLLRAGHDQRGRRPVPSRHVWDSGWSEDGRVLGAVPSGPVQLGGRDGLLSVPDGCDARDLGVHANLSSAVTADANVSAGLHNTQWVAVYLADAPHSFRCCLGFLFVDVCPGRAGEVCRAGF